MHANELTESQLTLIVIDNHSEHSLANEVAEECHREKKLLHCLHACAGVSG